MDRFDAKRSMGKAGETPGSAIDSASQKNVTVRRVFPGGPGVSEQAVPKPFVEIPFPAAAACRRFAVLMNLAPLSAAASSGKGPVFGPSPEKRYERFNFEGIISPAAEPVNRISEIFRKVCAVYQRKPAEIPGGLWYSNDIAPEDRLT